ncbi:DNA polymerase III, partial [Candidatus Parcubacteria bacterium]
MLEDMATAYILKKGNIFQIRAYKNAATAVEHSTVEVKDLWEAGRLDQIPNVGEGLQQYLDELFKTGKVKHWEEVKNGIPEQVFEFTEISGVGPKTAFKLAQLGVEDIEDLKDKLRSGELIKKGFSQKVAEKLLPAIEQMSFVKSGRMLLPYAFNQAQKVIDYVKKSAFVEKIEALGSLRRMVATIGDLDFAVTSNNIQQTIEHIINLPDSQVVKEGETQVTLSTSSGLNLDFIITKPESFGSLLQHYTGSKAHNIHLRKVAEKKGLSLSEHGIREAKNQKPKVFKTATEKEFYHLLGMDVPPPEIREDTGEIEAALAHKLPDLVKQEDIKGDLHIHDNFPIETGRDLGLNSIEEIAEQAKILGYLYVGVADHTPSISNHTNKEMVALVKTRTRLVEQYNSSHISVRVLNLLEVDILPDGRLSVPEEALKLLDFAIVSVHSGHWMDKENMTKRIIKALESPYVKVLGHPTGRLLNQRESYEVDWNEVFKFAAKNNKALEINSSPDRLDLPDILVRQAKEKGVKFVINTDSHEINSMEIMRFGVAVARRG